MGMVITQWESHGNENNETGIPWEWEYDLNFGGWEWGRMGVDCMGIKGR